MMKYLKNDRGDFGVPFTACFILAMVILLVMLMTWVSAEVTCLCIRNTVKNELTNVSIRISEDTYKAMREGNLNEYYRTLTDDEVYRNGLESLVKTKIASPVNAYIALAMTAELTGSETQAQVLDVLGADDAAELRRQISAVWEEIYENNGKEISVLANSLWLDDDAEYVQEKMDSISYDYYASVYQGDLGSEKTNRAMTNWMRNQTGGMLKDRTGNVQIDPEDQVLAIASTIYFQSKWVDEFDKADNTQAIFHAVSGDVEATFMNKEEYEMNYYWGEDYGAVQMFLENGSFMWFILPDEGKTVDDVLASDEYMKMITEVYSSNDEERNSKRMKVNLSVPQFDVSAGVNLKESLRNIGLSELFDPAVCDFSPSILPADDFSLNPYVASIHQDTRVKIDEQGVTAASYIEIIGAGAAEPPDEIIDFVLDRPFVFAVTKSDIPLFVGTVNKP